MSKLKDLVGAVSSNDDIDPNGIRYAVLEFIPSVSNTLQEKRRNVLKRLEISGPFEDTLEDQGDSSLHAVNEVVSNDKEDKSRLRRGSGGKSPEKKVRVRPS